VLAITVVGVRQDNRAVAVALVAEPAH
jgi:hypothetical protein